MDRDAKRGHLVAVDLDDIPGGCEVTVDGVRAGIPGRQRQVLTALSAGLVAFGMGLGLAGGPLFFAAGAAGLGVMLVPLAARKQPREIRVSERDLVLVWSKGLIPWSTRREHFPLTEVESLKVRHGRDLLLKTSEETRVITVGNSDVVSWLEKALSEARAARKRRENKDRREYLFEQVVPEEVEQLLD